MHELNTCTLKWVEMSCDGQRIFRFRFKKGSLSQRYVDLVHPKLPRPLVKLRTERKRRAKDAAQGHERGPGGTRTPRLITIIPAGTRHRSNELLLVPRGGDDERIRRAVVLGVRQDVSRCRLADEGVCGVEVAACQTLGDAGQRTYPAKTRVTRRPGQRVPSRVLHQRTGCPPGRRADVGTFEVSTHASAGDVVGQRARHDVGKPRSQLPHFIPLSDTSV